MSANLFENQKETMHFKAMLNKNMFDLIKSQTITLNKLSARYEHTKQPEGKLLRQPVPTLQQTLDKFLLSAKPHLTDKEFQQSVCVVKKFTENEGPTLQAILVEKAKCTENWLKEWWLNTAYLAYRDPVVVHSSPGMMWPFAEFKCDSDRIRHAANMIAGAVDYKLLIYSGEMPPEKAGKDFLDMQQYRQVFGTCRIPAPGLDVLQYNPDSKHIIVAHNNHFYKVDVIGSDCKPLNIDQLMHQLECVIEDSPDKAEHAVGVLSSDNRDNWACAYALLMEDPCNAQSLDIISRSLFLMCFDKLVTGRHHVNRQTLASHALIHGGGSAFNAGNRWFDKTIQFVVIPDGINGLTYEHSPAEGQPVAIMTDYIVNYIASGKGRDRPPSKHSGNPIKLDFNVNREVEAAIEKANINIDREDCNLDMNCGTFLDFGREFIKSQKLSPDSYIQVALQYAFYRLHRTPGAHYESASLRRFLHGRTETIRSCSIESIAFAKTMLDNCASNEDKVAALKAAIASHKKYTIDAMNGFGVDRHLLGLKLAAIECNMEVPALYKDPSFTRSSRMRISTSQVATRCDGLMVFGALVADGYSCCYNPRKTTINFAVSAYNEDPHTKARIFRAFLEQSLKDMHDVLCKAQKAKL